MSEPRTFDDLMNLVAACIAEASPAPWPAGHVATRDDIELITVLKTAWPLIRNRMSALEEEVFRMRRHSQDLAGRLEDTETRLFLENYMRTAEGLEL